jgi:hypothetical protein
MPAVSSLVIVQRANVTLGTAEATLFPQQAPAGIAMPPLGTGRQAGWIALAIITIPGITNVPSNATVTVRVHAGTSPADPEIGTVKWMNPTNQISPVGIGSFAIPIPVGTQSMFVGAFADSGAPVANATSTEPIAFILLGLATPD